MKNTRNHLMKFTDDIVRRAAAEERPLTRDEEDLVAEYAQRLEEIDLTEEWAASQGTDAEGSA